MIETFQKSALAAQFADEKKAQEIVILDVRGLCNFTDAFVICTGNSGVQLNAICAGIVEGFKRLGVSNPGDDGQRDSSWLVLDYGDVVVHVMNPEARGFYRLEKLWGDARELSWPEVLAEFPSAVGSEG